MKIALQLKATLENVTTLTAEGDDFRYYLKIQCLNCGEAADHWQYVCATDSSDLKGGRGSANLVLKCKFCQRENSMDILEDRTAPYTAEDETFQTIAVFECRGVSPIDFSPRGGWSAKAIDSGTVFPDVDLTEGDWCGYDEKRSQSVGVYELEHKFIKAKS